MRVGCVTFRFFPAAAAIAVLLSLCACGPSKNTAMSRNYQAFITRYNVYYNGDTHFKETLADMESKYDDDYSRLLYLHPVDAYADEDAAHPSASFTRSIEKAQKAIQTRSIKKRPARKPGHSSDPAYKAWMKREEYNPFLHNAWMLLAESQFYNGDFGGAAATFYYISKHFSWLPSTVTLALIWQARCYVEMDWLFEAETILRRIKPEELSDRESRSAYAYTSAGLWIRSKEYAKAIPFLEEALKYSSGAQKTRIRFLMGQLYDRIGDKGAAYREFGEAAKSSSASYRTRFNARIKQSEVYSGADFEKEVKALTRMTRYDRNKEYLDQVYYAIGNLYLSRGDTAKAMQNYALAVEKSTRGGVDKAIAQVALGNLYFSRRDYVEAQPCYAEALPSLPKSFPDFRQLQRRSDVLDELAIYARNVELQDSLLRLAAMSEDERMKVIDGIIARLKEKERREAEDARREEYLAAQNAAGSTLTPSQASPAPSTFTMNTDNSWYFYNTSVLNAGKAEFQRRWGSRKLEDDWRRHNKASFSLDEPDDDGENSDSIPTDDRPDDAENTAGNKAAETDPHNPEYYLAQIPLTEQEKANSAEIIREGLYNMGLILKDKLEDYPAARVEFDRLLRDYPDNEYRLDVYYNMYLMAVREKDMAAADRWRDLIVADFPDSPHGVAMKNPQYLQNLMEMERIQHSLYERTYEAYLDNRNDEVHEAYRTMESEYPMSKLMPKFMFLHALAYVTEDRPEDFNSTLRDMLSRYPDADAAPIASAWVKGMAEGRTLHSGGTNLRGMIWDTRLTADSTAVAEADSIEFTVDPASPQLLVLLYPTDSINANKLLYDVAYFNFNTFVVKDFDLEQMNFGRLGLLVVSGFDNRAQLSRYRHIMAESEIFTLPPEVRPIEISRENFDRLLHSGGSFEQYFRFIDDRNYEINDRITQSENPDSDDT